MSSSWKYPHLIDPSWLELFQKEMEKPYFQNLRAFLVEEKRRGAIVYPPSQQIFTAFLQTALDQVKVVIMGQDPYHGPGQAHGLSFSVPEGIPQPPSLQNIFKELRRDLQIATPSSGSLLSWAKQGVLLLNATLTVRQGEPKSHFGRGWEIFTDQIIKALCSSNKSLVFLLWGKSALDKFQQIQTGQTNQHLILTAPHPSPLSAYSGFFGSSHFSKTNIYLNNWGLTPIDWKIF
jgi:uracil-DNA glycosylase